MKRYRSTSKRLQKAPGVKVRAHFKKGPRRARRVG